MQRFYNFYTLYLQTIPIFVTQNKVLYLYILIAEQTL